MKTWKPSAQSSAHTLYYTRPAETWTDALPIGNGRLGAMVSGDPQTERFALNEVTLWAGSPHNYDPPKGLDALPEVRRLIFAGDFEEAHRLTDATLMGNPVRQMPYQSPGTLLLRFSESSAEDAEVTEYHRALDLTTAIAHTEYTQHGSRYFREAFVSHPDQIMVIRLTSDTPGSLNFAVALESKLEVTHEILDLEPASENNALTLKMHGIGGMAEGIPGSIRFSILVRAVVEGGTVTGSQDPTQPAQLTIRNADAVTLFVSIATGYRDYESTDKDENALAQDYLAAAVQKSYESLKAGHLADYRAFYSRVILDLGETVELSSRPTDERLLSFPEDNDPNLAALYYHYGRYLLISCSRPGGQPATLQGLWNDSLTPPWGSKYTININTEMNYWLAEPANLAECHEPLFDLITQIAMTGRHTAETLYGAKRGWVAHHNTDIWRGTSPVDGSLWGIWPMGGAWLCTHLWTHYEYSQNVETLRKHYPLLKGAAEFFLETLVPEPSHGWLVTCPSISPENEHHPKVSICAGPTMDTQIIRDLFSACLKASLLLETQENREEAEGERAFRVEVERVKAKLAPMQIGRAGQLQEWLEDWDTGVPEPHHRHVSHLYGLHPSDQINPKETPDLFAAARKTLELRGDAGTGWSLAWKINFWARLLDGDHAYELIKRALTLVDTQNTNYQGGGGVYRNLFDAHPPFQIDGNFGYVSGVTEMLLQSQGGEIHLLPALPSCWQSGSISGIRARGGHTLTLKWSAGQLAETEILSNFGGTVTVRYADRVKTFETTAGGTLKLTQEDFAS